jgi:hypothetical protein
MSTIIDLVYKIDNINVYNNIETTDLYSNQTCKNIIGKAVFNLNLIKIFNGTNFETIYTDNVTFFLNNNNNNNNNNNPDSILFTVSLFNNTNGQYILPDTLYTFQILGGSGKYNGATGNVYIYADISGTRYVKIIIN